MAPASESPVREEPEDAQDKRYHSLITLRARDLSAAAKTNKGFTQEQEEVRMQIRMHIIEESRAEWREMPQNYDGCPDCWLKGVTPDHISCRKCGSIYDKTYGACAIKEPRFHKNTHHMEPMDLYK